MKQTKRRLLSLLMAFAILCTMIPAAFAADSQWGAWSPEKCTDESDHTPGTISTTTEATCTATGLETQKCEKCDATRTRVIPMKEHTWGTEYKYDGTYHWQVCTVCKAERYEVCPYRHQLDQE